MPQPAQDDSASSLGQAAGAKAVKPRRHDPAPGRVPAGVWRLGPVITRLRLWPPTGPEPRRSLIAQPGTADAHPQRTKLPRPSSRCARAIGRAQRAAIDGIVKSPVCGSGTIPGSRAVGAIGPDVPVPPRPAGEGSHGCERAAGRCRTRKVQRCCLDTHVADAGLIANVSRFSGRGRGRTHGQSERCTGKASSSRRSPPKVATTPPALARPQASPGAASSEPRPIDPARFISGMPGPSRALRTFPCKP